MSGWELTLINEVPVALDAAPLTSLTTCSNVNSVHEIALPSQRPGISMLVAELFKVQPRSDELIVIQGDLTKCHRVGLGWSLRSLLIEGDVGNELGTAMRSGCIRVVGNANDMAGCQMRGGCLQIGGNAGDYLGGPLPGRRSGMSGGRIVLSGNAGCHAGHRMRRGTIIVCGDAQDTVASDMVAGTIAIQGNAGHFVGAGMKRGTVILQRTHELSPIRFVRSRHVETGITRLIAADLRDDAPELAEQMTSSLNRFLGDRSAGGMGEIWMP